MSESKPAGVEFEGEEPGSGYASPMLDLVATAFLVVVSGGFMVAALRLPVPGNLTTAPGLLPFLVAATLLCMAAALGASAIRRRHSGARAAPVFEGDRGSRLRTLFLGVAVACYIAALQVFAFQERFEFSGFSYRLSAFEPVTVIALSAIIHVFWRGPLSITVSVSAGWAFILSLVFQKVFNIPLPGSF